MIRIAFGKRDVRHNVDDSEESPLTRHKSDINVDDPFSDSLLKASPSHVDIEGQNPMSDSAELIGKDLVT